MSFLITGFGPFGTVAQNPAQTLAEESGFRFETLEVSFDAVDRFVESVACTSVLMLGVATSRSLVSLELTATNRVGDNADVRGTVPVVPSVSGHAESVNQSLWTFEQLKQWRSEPDLVQSHDAGDFLCNYLFYRIRVCRPEIPAAFLHVVSFQHIGKERQLEIVRLVTSPRET
jgi:pyrrolidone-carboxylate peptidase